MPKSDPKGKILEHVVLQLERALSEGASNLSIQRRARLEDRTGCGKREMDVFISYTLAGRAHRVGVECRHHRARVDVQYVEQLATKRADLNLDIITVVSRAGFTKGAVKKANHHQIRLNTLKDVDDPAWARFVVAPVMHEVKITTGLARCNLGLVSAPEGFNEALVKHDGALVQVRIGEQITDLNSVLREQAAQPEAREIIKAAGLQLTEPLDLNGERVVELQVGVPDDVPVSVSIGDPWGWVAINRLHLGLRVVLKQAALTPTFAEYLANDARSASARSASFSLADGTVVNVVHNPSSRELHWSAMHPDADPTANVRMIVTAADESGEQQTVATFDIPRAE